MANTIVTAAMKANVQAEYAAADRVAYAALSCQDAAEAVVELERKAGRYTRQEVLQQIAKGFGLLFLETYASKRALEGND